MFSRKKNKAPQTPQVADKSAARKGGGGVPSIMSSDMRIVGNIVSDGIVDIDGVVEGNVRSHVATVRKNGHIKGDVIAESVYVYGKIQGLIKARSVHFFKGCRAEGVIMHESITIEDGAFVDGRFKRVEKIDLDDTGDGSGGSIPASEVLGEPKKRTGLRSSLEGEAGQGDSSNSSFVMEEEAAEEKPEGKKGKKRESALDNLRLISDAS